jgi:hypothetical protein
VTLLDGVDARDDAPLGAGHGVVLSSVQTVLRPG